MRTIRKLLLLSLSTIVLATGASTAASGAGGCVKDIVTAAASEAAALADGGVLAAVRSGTVVVLDEQLAATAYLHTGNPGMTLRHAAASRGLGVTYVEDRLGADAIHHVTSTGATSFVPGGEATHPALASNGSIAYAVDLERIEVRRPDGSTRIVDRPEGTSGLFSPLFRSDDEVVVVAEEAAHAEAHTHDDTLNNLWSHDLRSGAWRRLTAFSASGDEWSILRTPVLGGAGEILVIRVTGRASAEGEPRYELWEVRGAETTRLRTLPGEAFLAGMTSHGLVWNGFDGDWRLFLETPGGPRFLACGGAMVDPRLEADPDRADDEPLPVEATVAQDLTEPDGEGALGIAIGDYDGRAEATVAAALLGMPTARIVGHDEQPLAVAEERFAILIPIGPLAQPEDELDALRARFPEVKDRSWIVPVLTGQG